MKKALALILSLVMMLALMPVSVAASATATLMTELPDTGDRVIIHNTVNNKALDACGTSGYYNAGVDLTPVDGVISGFGENVIWDVTKNEDGTYRFSQNGKYLSMGAQYASTPYDEVNKDWAVETHGNSGYSIKNVARAVYLEWYAKNNYFSGYANIDDSGAFDFLFYKVEGVVIAAPTAEPAAGTIVKGGTVKLSCETEGATVYWKNGEEGTFAAYTAPIEINEDCTIYAYAEKDGTQSDTVSFAYTVVEGIMNIKQALEAGTMEHATVIGQLVYRYGNRGAVNTAVLQAKIDGKVYALQVYNSLETDPAGEQTFSIGDWIVIKGLLQPFNGTQQIQSPEVIRLATEEELALIDSEDVTAPLVCENFAEIPLDIQSLYIMVKNVTLGEYNANTTGNQNTTMTDSAGATTTVYRAAPYPAGIEKGDVVNLYGAVSVYQGKAQIRNGSSKDYVPTNDVKGPVITRVTNGEAEVGKAYTFTATVLDASGIANVVMEVYNGETLLNTFEDPAVEDDNYTIVIPAASITGGNLTVKVTATDKWETPNITTETYEITVIDLPQITGFTPEANSSTGDDKRPVISVTFANCGENPTVEMKLNDVAVTPVIEGNTATYTPAEDMEDGKVTVYVKITRADEKFYETTWNFTVGVATYQLYFGELHSHTAEYSDGTGTLEQALEHAKNATQIDFLAVTDHSNYYDTKDNPNGDMTDASKGKMTADGSKTLWQEAKDTAKQYADANFIPIIGYEMTWSGQYGHMNTFNSIGFESRNVPKYVVKGGPGLVAYYDRLVEVARIDKEYGRKTTINQFNHPGTTFGTFEDFAHYTPAYDELITMIEVGNGEGKVGGSMYWPSYQYYTMALDKGWHLAPTNNQDNHKGGWGDSNTCRDVIYTDNFSEEGIYDAMRAMTMYATEDNDLEIYYTLNDNVMGSILNLEQGAKLTIRVDFKDPTDKVQKVSVIANGDVTVASKTFNAQTGSWELTIDNNYSYYYIRVDEVDADIAVTAPVWTSETVKIGMSPVEKDTTIELKGEPITFSVPLYNYEEPGIGEDASAIAFEITKAEYSIDGEIVYTDNAPKFSDGTNMLTTTKQDGKLTWIYTPTETGRFKMEVKVTGTFRGAEYVFNGNLGFIVRDGADMATMVIDAGHSNFYISGNYAGDEASIVELGARNGVKSVLLRDPITDEALANCDMLILSVPYQGYENAGNYVYTDAELEAISNYAARGGNFIICSKSDRGDPAAEDQQASTISNKLLTAVGAKARFSKGIVSDIVNNTNESYRLHFTGKEFYNWDNPLTEYLIETTNLMYSSYNAGPIILNGAESIVNAFDTSFVASYPLHYTGNEDRILQSEKKYQPYYDAAGDQDVISVLAYEKLPAGGFCITSGTTFFSTFEVHTEIENAGTLQNTNYQIVVNLLKMIHPNEVTPIADIHEAGKLNTSYTIEGYVTSNASGYDKDTAFFDCIYIQDDSGRGINVFPVAGRYEVGQKLRITGMTSEYMGEIELNCGNDYGGEIQDITLRDVEYTADGVTTVGYATRARLLDVAITMANMQTIETYVIDDGNLNTVIDGICAQNAEQYVVPETLSTAGAANPSKVGNLVSFTGRVTKVEYDANGVLGAIHVDDGTGEVVIFLDGYINTDASENIGEDGYYDLSWVKEGVALTASGIASIGQNSYENSDQIGPRIRTRNRADIARYIPLYGDTNCDGIVTAADAAIILRSLVGLSTATFKGVCNADVDGDDDVTSADAAMILRYMVGLINKLGPQEAN